MEPNGGAGEFAEFYRRWHGRVLAGVIVFSGDSDHAADATSEAFARAYERWERVREMDAPEGWVFEVARNVLRRRWRRARLERKRHARLAVPDVVPENVMEPGVWAAVAALPEQQRHAIVARYVLDLTQAQVADLLDVAPGTAASLLARARNQLARAIDREEEMTP